MNFCVHYKKIDHQLYNRKNFSDPERGIPPAMEIPNLLYCPMQWELRNIININRSIFFIIIVLSCCVFLIFIMYRYFNIFSRTNMSA